MKLAIAVFIAVPAFACQVVDGDQILGRHLAAANPLFATLNPDLELWPTPLAGVRRIIHAEELARLAQQYLIEIPAPIAEVCMERATEPLSAEKLLPVLRRALAFDGAEIEILDFSRYGVPRGVIEFTRSGLSPSGFWRGRVAYSEGRSAPAWVKVRVSVERTWIEAAEPLAAGQTIGAEQLIVRKGPRFPFEAPPLNSIELAQGRRTLRAIRPGEAVFATMLLASHDIERGEMVAVTVTSGRAVLDFEAKAESSGSVGETILVDNPASGRRFPAKIESKGKVSVTK